MLEHQGLLLQACAGEREASRVRMLESVVATLEQRLSEFQRVSDRRDVLLSSELRGLRVEVMELEARLESALKEARENPRSFYL